MRELTKTRKAVNLLLYPFVMLFLWLFWALCRKQIKGEKNIQTLIDSNQAFIPCYWHQQQLMGMWYIRRLLKKNIRLGFLVSPSVDGEVPAQLAKSWGAHVIRGSHTRGGAKTLRELYNMIKDGLSIVNTPDGPKGPAFKFKPGTLMLAQLSGAPILPISIKVYNPWQLKTWDQSQMPKPLSKVCISIGEPVYIEKGLPDDKIREFILNIENNLNN
jgi:lysophospholipid acyltransferase (LPLAT)-like uncharacterized protein